MRSRWIGLSAALLTAAAGVTLLLLALDVRRYEQRLGSVDAVYRADPARDDLWRPAQVVPFGAARRLLGIDDDLRFRQTLRLFALGQPWASPVQVTPVMVAHRSEAQVALVGPAEHDPLAWRRSRELNMLGVLDLVAFNPVDSIRRLQALLRASASFRSAIVADETDADAKFNLEVALRLIQDVPLDARTLRGLGGTATEDQPIGEGY